MQVFHVVAAFICGLATLMMGLTAFVYARGTARGKIAKRMTRRQQRLSALYLSAWTLVGATAFVDVITRSNVLMHIIILAVGVMLIVEGVVMNPLVYNPPKPLRRDVTVVGGLCLGIAGLVLLLI